MKDDEAGGAVNWRELAPLDGDPSKRLPIVDLFGEIDRICSGRLDWVQISLVPVGNSRFSWFWKPLEVEPLLGMRVDE